MLLVVLATVVTLPVCSSELVLSLNQVLTFCAVLFWITNLPLISVPSRYPCSGWPF